MYTEKLCRRYRAEYLDAESGTTPMMGRTVSISVVKALTRGARKSKSCVDYFRASKV